MTAQEDSSEIKIWYQLVSSRRRLPNFLAEIQRQCDAVVSPGTQVDVRGTESGGLGDQFLSIRHLHGSEMIRTAAREFGNGHYSAYAVANSMDPALGELRELLDAPVLSFMEVGCFLASLVGERMGIITPNDKMAHAIGKIIEGYGLGRRVVGFESIKLDNIPDFDRAFASREHSAPILLDVTRSAESLVERGADVLLTPGPTSCLMAQEQVNELAGVPVIDMYNGLAKVTEAAATLREKCGLRASRNGIFAAPAPEFLACVLKES
jgi:Asp/Glu/hydantoin racemase